MIKPASILAFVVFGAALAPVVALAVDRSTYDEEILDWRKRRAERLTAEDGWLTVAGLFWLKPGENRFGSAPENAIVLPAGSAPPAAGSFVLAGDSVVVRVRPGVAVTCEGKPVVEMTLRSDQDGKPEVLALDDLRLFLIKRTKGYAIRMRHLNAPARRQFTGLDYFPIDPAWRVEARFVPYDPPKPIPIPSVVGTVDTMRAPGYAEFTRDGRIYRLDPVLESDGADELFFIFKDETSGVETYPPGRFLYSDLPAAGKVVLDFNRAYNPPCAFTDFATCPLPPSQNALRLRVTAGEQRYGHH
jgi:uncharacterized protein (DUF1684 family)